MRDKPLDVMHEKETAILAYCYWEERGRPLGNPEVDWFRAEAELTRVEQLRRCGGIQ